MRAIRAIVVPAACAALCAALALPALGADPVKPEHDLGAGPHRDRSSKQSGEGTTHDRAASGSSAAPATPDDANAEHMRKDDERNSNESKDRIRKRPGYKNDVPAPRG